MRFSKLTPEPHTPADLFMSRYGWLVRWAVHFARNDRATAEDLIQETFLRFSQANLMVTEIRDVEALLYTYLEHVHLSHMREVTRHSFVSLADAKLDALALGLLTGPDVDRIETQNLLRRIAAYVAWRKQTSKSATIVGLRFFHGFLPEEIARIALVSREAVDERLHNGRNEIRLHLLDSEKLRRVQHGGPVEVFPSKVVVPTDEFLRELRNQLFHASYGVCVPPEQLTTRYRKSADVPIRRDLLAHIVSCPKCLPVVERISRHIQSADGSGRGGGSVGIEHGHHREPSLSSVKEMENVVRRAERRMKEIFEHRPTALIVAVNGEILASRDIRASFNGLKVEVLTRDLKFIEVLNEYGVSLLSWAVESTPPHSDPVLHRVAEFSMARRLEVDLQFSAQKLVIDVQYHDPSCRDAQPLSFAALTPAANEEDGTEAEIVNTGEPWITVLGRKSLKPWGRLRWAPFIATAFVGALVLAMAFMPGLKESRRVGPAGFLEQALASEKRDAQNARSGLIVQQVTIRSSQGAFERSIYRDPEGKRRAKEQPLDEKKMRLKRRLADAGIDWDAPLSAASFGEWETRNRIKSQSVQSINDELLRLRVDTEGSEVEQETITIRRSDFHPIDRTAEFRDLGTVEIAEVNYAVVPWATINQNLFESDIGASGMFMAPRSFPLHPQERTIPDVEFDLAELEVREALHELRADVTDRLTISRSATGIQVEGLAEDDEQKLDLQRRMHLILHVSTNLKTMNEASAHSAAAMPTPNVQVASVVAEPSLLETFLQDQGRSREDTSELAHQLFAASSTLLRANKGMIRLRERFPSDKLSSDALDIYNRLLTSWIGEFDTALADESEAIRQTGIPIPPNEDVRPGPVDTDAGIENNRVLVKELIGHDASNTRTAPAVLADLFRSIEALRTAASEEHEKIIPTTPSDLPSAKVLHP